MRTILIAAMILPGLTLSAHAQAVELFEDDADELIKQFNDGVTIGGSDATPELRDVYSGVSAIRVTPFQRFSAGIKGWRYPIVEKPQPGQYRYLRFAWKRVNGPGIMIQLYTPDTWNQRLIAGKRSDQTLNWGPALAISDKNPSEWTMVTRDLFKDFGPMTLQGLALTPMDGGGYGLFDHFYLGASIDDLDRASADAFGKTPLKSPLTLLELGELWEDLAKSEVGPSGKAVRRLLAGRKESVPYLATMLRSKRPAQDIAKIARWIDALADEDFATREAAYAGLDQLGDPATPHLLTARAKQDPGTSRPHRGALEESPRRGRRLTGEQLRIIRAVRVLEWAQTAEALQALEELAKTPPDEMVSADIRAARERLAKVIK